MPRPPKSLLVAALALALSACAGTSKSVVVNPEAPLGRVIIYRNGVAYFEREAEVEDALSLRVPRARVDDFLKSLTVTDTETGKPLPISYPTTRGQAGNFVDMTIALPPGQHRVKLAYVTESPAWKPSYRVMLGEGGESSRLQSWAIVDNVSGERWSDVKVGVGSTSALSFRYDLHSVVMVQRETLDTGTLLAQAPPTGGSPYAVDRGNVRVLANLSAGEVQQAPAQGRGISLAGSTAAESNYTVQGADIPVGNSTSRDFTAVINVAPASSRDSRGQPPAMGTNAGTYDAAPTRASALQALQAELANNQTRVRIEGWGLQGEDNPQREGLRRANTLREQLVANGIAADRIDVVAGNHAIESPDDVVQVIALEQEATFSEAVVEGVDPDEPRGTAHFISEEPMSLDPGHSAMVTLFDEPTEAARVYLYDPLSARGSKRFAFNAVRVINPSDDTLDRGPITVYAKGRFLGEGLTEPVPPGKAALVPYALDRTVLVSPSVQTREQVEKLVTVERGIATTQTRRTRQTRLEIDNRGHAEARVYVRHRVSSGWTLQDPPKTLEHLGRDILLPITIAAGTREEVVLEETLPVTTSVDLRSEHGLEQIAVYLQTESIAAPLRERLEAIIGAYRDLNDVESTLATRHEQRQVLRQRVDELESQLIGLRKVRRAQDLSGHLAKRMRQLGDKLDEVTVEVTELETDRLKATIQLQNLVAELTLEEAEPAAGGSTRASAP